MTPRAQPAVRLAAAVATYRREAELTRLLDSLAASDLPLAAGVFVADNAAAPETATVCQQAPLSTAWLPQKQNCGPGPAWNAAITRAFADHTVTHVLVLDDDVVPPADTASLLLQTLEATASAAAAPLLFDDKDHLWAFPEPREVALRPAIRQAQSPRECLAVCGPEPHAFCWATGACMLYRRDALEQSGLFREDFWMLGEDLELSMRIAANFGGAFTAQAVVPHLPPPPDPATSRAAHRAKFLALLQNLSYLAFHSPHRAHLRRYLAGNFKRYVRTEGCDPGTLRDGWTAFRLGALRAKPSGTPAGENLRARGRRRCLTP
jgi:hypothetical protein